MKNNRVSTACNSVRASSAPLVVVPRDCHLSRMPLFAFVADRHIDEAFNRYSLSANRVSLFSHLATSTHQPLGGTLSTPLASNFTPMRMSADYSQAPNPTSEVNSTAVYEGRQSGVCIPLFSLFATREVLESNVIRRISTAHSASDVACFAIFAPFCHNSCWQFVRTTAFSVDGTSSTTAASVHHCRSRAQSKVSHMSQLTVPEEETEGNADQANDDEATPFFNDSTPDKRTCQTQPPANAEPQTVASSVTQEEFVTVDTVVVADDDRTEVELILTEIVAQKGTFL